MFFFSKATIAFVWYEWMLHMYQALIHTVSMWFLTKQEQYKCFCYQITKNKEIQHNDLVKWFIHTHTHTHSRTTSSTPPPSLFQTPVLLTPSPLPSTIHFWSTLSPIAPRSPAKLSFQVRLPVHTVSVHSMAAAHHLSPHTPSAHCMDENLLSSQSIHNHQIHYNIYILYIPPLYIPAGKLLPNG